MAKIYFTFFILLFSIFQAQIVNIPDANLKAKLLAANTTNNIAQDNNFNNIKIDTNSNNEIELSEALTVYNLFLSSSQNQGVNLISNISGLTAFSNLKYLNLDNNNLTSLDATPFTNLQKLHISYNPLSSLNVNNLLNLKLLWCRSLLNFTTLDISNLPSLEDFRCNGNQLISLNLSNKPNLISFDCSNNNIASLNLSSLSNLEYLYINNNPLNFIDLSSQSKINTLNSMYTNIQTINVMGQFNLQTLMVGNTPTLEYVFMKNGSYETGTNFEYLPNLKYVCVDVNNTLENYNMTYLSNLPGNNFVVNSYCNFSPGGVTNLIAGNTKYDSNNNGCDANDLNSAYQKFQISGYGGNGSIIANNSGNYSIPVQAGTHTITPILENPAYFNISPASFTANFPSMTSPLTQNFCLTANGNHNDLEVLIIPITAAAPGFNAKYKIIYKNKGTASQSGTLVFNFNDNLMNFLTSTLAPNAQTTGVLNWNFTNLLPFESREITVTFTLNTPTQNPPLLGGNILNYSAQINGATDETLADNLFTLNQTVVNSFDPNDKTCLEGTTIAPTQIGNYVHYLIRFENTGTANAQNIVVKDDIDLSKFDLATLVPLNASHNFVTRISGSNTVEFIFENIQLPFLDATNDGFVAFKIKTKSNLVLGNTFSNTAKIYFDYNAPIVTNTYATTVQNFLATSETVKKDQSFSIFPNPAHDVLQIRSKEKIVKTEIYDVAGRILKSSVSDNEKIDLSDLPKGNYLIKIFTKDKISAEKFIKN